MEMKELTGLDSDIASMMFRNGSIQWRDDPFALRSGIKSHVYFYGREDFTDDPELLYFVARNIASTVLQSAIKRHSKKQPCLIGIPTAGTQFAIAASLASYQSYITLNGVPICCRVMKEVKKEHGAHFTWVNGESDPDRHEYWLVDNVATSGGTFIEAAEKLKESGYPSIHEISCLIFVDRQQGGVKKIQEAGFKQVVVLYNLLDIVFTFSKLGLWTLEKVSAVREEIEAHQI